MPNILRDMTQPKAQTDRVAELEALVAKLMAEKDAKRPVTLKVSDKGGLSVYGLGRFPVTLYRRQWEKLLAQADAIRAFIQSNAASLSVKGE